MIALGYFILEVFVYGTVSIQKSLSPAIIASESIHGILVPPHGLSSGLLLAPDRLFHCPNGFFISPDILSQGPEAEVEAHVLCRGSLGDSDSLFL
jgi:hypothetical protein